MRFLLLLLTLLALLACTGADAAPRMRAEFEDHPGLLLGCSDLVYNHPQLLVALAAAVDDDVPIFGLVADHDVAEAMAEILEAANLDPERIEAVIMPTKGMWVRDYGPVFVSDGSRFAMVDPRYVIEPDDTIPARLADLWGLPYAPTALWCEGGHLAHNGQGLLLVSSTVARLNYAHEKIDGGEITSRLQQSLPFNEAHWIRPMPDEPTGHLDMFIHFVGPDRVVVASTDPGTAPELAEHLDNTARRLAKLEGPNHGLEVLRIPTPAPQDGIWYTYTNVILIADQVLVPVYPELGPDQNDRALEFWRDALPGREVIGIDSSSIIRRRGALHCISVPLPVLPATHRG